MKMVQISCEDIRTVNFAALEEDADQRRMQRRKATAAKRRASRQQTSLDDMDLEGLPMPALTSLKARSEKRDGKFKKKGLNMTQAWKEKTKVCLQKTRHMESTRANRIAKNAWQNEMSFQVSEADAPAMA